MRITRSLDDRCELPASVERHLESCAGCRSFHRQQRTLDGLLQRGAEAPRSGASPFLRGRILSEIRGSGAAASLPRRLSQLNWALSGAVAVVVVGAVTWFSLSTTPTPVTPAPARQQASFRGAPAIFTSPMTLLEGVELQSVSRKLDEPLERELNLIMDDARNAVRVLAQNFVPDSMRRNPSPPGLQ